MRKIVFLLCIFGFRDCLAQGSGQPSVSLTNVVPKSPQASQLERVSDISVNAARGVPNISFTLYTASAGSLKIPISISYDASGVKYDDVPSAVGLKWSLQAGGEVSRSINGKPDESYYFANTSTLTQSYIYSNWNFNTSLKQDFLKDVAQNSKDISQDTYTYTYLDKTANFFYRNNKFWDVKQPMINKIEVNSFSTMTDFTITDGGGNKAYFGNGNIEATYPLYGGSGYKSFNAPSTGSTAWKLNELEAYTGEQAQFEYESYDYSFARTISEAFVVRQSPGVGTFNCNCGNSDLAESTLETEFFIYLPKKITTPSEVVQFYYSTDNSLSIYKRRLDSMTVKNRDSVVVKRVHFNYGKHSGVNLLKLNAVWDMGSGDSVLIAGFHYTDGIGGITSYARDIFNYNNGTGNTRLIATTNSSYTGSYNSADRYPSSTAIANGNLDTLYYATGGKALFYYSANVVGGTYGPGARIDSIKYLNGDNSFASQLTYTYASPANGINYGGVTNAVSFDDNNTNCPVTTISSEINQSTPPLTFYYGEIEIRKKGATSSETLLTKEFYTEQYDGRITASPVLEKRIVFRGNNLSDTLRIDSYAYTSPSLDSLTMEWLYVGEPHLAPEVYTMDGQNVQNGSSCDVLYELVGVHAQLLPRTGLIAKTTSKEFDQNTSTRTLSTVASNQYNNYWQLLTESKWNSKGTKDSVLYNYLYTNGNSIATTATGHNLFNLVDKTTKFTDNTQVLQSRASFTTFSSHVLPDNFYSKTFANTELLDKTVTGYDANGQLTELDDRQGFYTSLLRDYNNKFVVSQTTGARLTDLAYNSFEADGTNGWSFTSSNIGSSGGAVTGKKYYSIPANDYLACTLSLNTSRTYVVSFWTNGGTLTLVKTTGTSPGFIYSSIGNLVTSYTNDATGWTYYEYTITGTSNLKIDNGALLVLGGVTYVPVKIDELRVYPKGALMTTYSYDPLIGMTAQCDASNRISYYTYDALSRLSLIKDQNNNILKKYSYNYPNILKGNTVQSQSFTRTNCGTNYIGGSVTYTVAANTYFALDQTVANSLALDDIAANGQNYANANGSCTVDCSFSMSSGFTNISSSIQNNGSTVSFFLTFSRNASMSALQTYSIGFVNGSCRPSADRSLSFSSAGKTWGLTIKTTGEMRLTMIGSFGTVSANTTLSTGTKTYNL